MDKNVYFKNAFVYAVCRRGNPDNLKEADMFLGTLNGRPAYAYVRVSNIRGGDNMSAEIQMNYIDETALREDYKVSWDRTYYDARGNKDLFSRPGVKALLEEIVKPENRGGIILVASLWDFTRDEAEWQKLGEVCIKNDTDILVCREESPYLLSVVLRILSPETTDEEKVKLIKTLGWDIKLPEF